MVGRRLDNDRYELLELLGEGGAARVFRARDHLLGRDVALKILRPEHASEPGAADRFRREATAAAGLSHPNIAQVYDIGVDENGVPYFVMELVPGGSLHDLLQTRGKLPVAEAVSIAKQVAAALRHAHESGIIHRDIKPLNILIGRDGQVKVVDFGIARALAQSQVTQAGNILGSVRYVSPEQARGEMATPQSDLYSLGVVLFEMLTGRPPYDGDSPVAIALMHAEAPVPDIRAIDPTIPPAIAAIVARAMAKDPAHRYVRAAELLSDLEAWESGRPSSVRAPQRAYEATTVIERPTLPPRPQPAYPPRSPLAEPPEPDGMSTLTMVLVALTAVVVLSGIGILWYITRSGPIGETTESGPTTVIASMPQVEGLRRTIALQLLRQAGIDENSVFIEEQEDENQTPNIVVRQYPPAGAQWHPGDRVTLVVTKKPEEPLVDSVATPNLIGKNVTEAVAILESWQLKADIIPDPGAVGSPGEVTMQAPVAGDMVPIGFPVRIYIVPESARPDGRRPQEEVEPPIETPDEGPSTRDAQPPTEPQEEPEEIEAPVTPPSQPGPPVEVPPSGRPEPGEL